MQLQPLPNYSQILAFQIGHKGSDLHKFINIVTCRILVFCLGLGGDSGEEEPAAGWRKSGSMQPRPPGELALGPGGAVVALPLHPVQWRAAAAVGLVRHEHTNWFNHSSLVSLLQYLFQNK